MTTLTDTQARIVLRLGVEPPAPAMHEFVAIEGPVDALRALNKRTAPDDVLAQYRRPSPPDVRRILAAFDAGEFVFITPTDDDFPTSPTDDLPPIGLWARGCLPLSGIPDTVAVTGADRPTHDAARTAADVARRVAQGARTVVVPSSRGVPSVAVDAALTTDHPADCPSIVVLSHGFNAHSPDQEYERLLAAGGVVLSEYAPGQQPTRHRRHAADRLVAALAQSTVVVEPTSSPAHTHAASTAAALGRRVFVLPGSTERAMPGAITELVESGAATVLADPADIAQVALASAPANAGRLHSGSLLTDPQ